MPADTDIVAALDGLTSGTYTLDDDAAGANLVAGPPRPVGTNMPQVAVFVTLTGIAVLTKYLDGGAKGRIERHDVTITVRSDINKFKEGQALALAIRDALVLVPPAGYVELDVSSLIPLQPQGANDDWRWTINCALTKEV